MKDGLISERLMGEMRGMREDLQLRCWIRESFFFSPASSTSPLVANREEPHRHSCLGFPLGTHKGSPQTKKARAFWRSISTRMGPAKVQRSHFPAHLEEGLMQVVFGCILMTAPEIFWQHSFAIENLQLEICFCSRESNPSETQPIQV